jgi:hypothetical protein
LSTIIVKFFPCITFPGLPQIFIDKPPVSPLIYLQYRTTFYIQNRSDTISHTTLPRAAAEARAHTRNENDATTGKRIGIGREVL